MHSDCFMDDFAAGINTKSSGNYYASDASSAG